MSKFRVICTVVLWATITPIYADQLSASDLNWMKKIVSAARQSDYIGTFIYQSGSYVETSRITHVRVGENEYERLEGLDGERSEIIRKNDEVWCYQGEGKVMVANLDGARTFPALLPEHLSLLQENYLISHGEDDRVAGFHAQSIVFQPMDNMRYAHKMWVRNDTALLLKSVVLDDNQNIIEQYAFTQLNVGGDIDRQWIKPDKIGMQQKKAEPAKVGHAKKVNHPSVSSGWKVYELPPGFVKITEVSRTFKGHAAPVIHLVFSDGLAGISLFVEKLGDRVDVKSGLFSKGILHIYTKIAAGNVLTVVGEVPPRTVMQVAESARNEGAKE